MQFKVPQDVQREDQIIGPLTLRQMVILGVGGGLTYLVYIQISKTYEIEAWLLPVAIISSLTIALAFLKIHGLPFHKFILHYIEYKFLIRKRIWIQKSANPYISPKMAPKSKIINKKTKKTKKKDEKSIKDLVKILNQ
jgi:hypothetical protein